MLSNVKWVQYTGEMRGLINPLIYDHVEEALRSLHLEVLDKLVNSFAKPFKRSIRV
jgi:hypothetical protein